MHVMDRYVGTVESGRPPIDVGQSAQPLRHNTLRSELPTMCIWSWCREPRNSGTRSRWGPRSRGGDRLVNEEVERLFGCLREELIVKRVEELLPERYRVAHLTHRGDYRDHPL